MLIVLLSCEAGIESINTALENDAERDIFVWIRVVVCNDFGNEHFIDRESCNIVLLFRKFISEGLESKKSSLDFVAFVFA